jgi:hypothetical protein
VLKFDFFQKRSKTRGDKKASSSRADDAGKHLRLSAYHAISGERKSDLEEGKFCISVRFVVVARYRSRTLCVSCDAAESEPDGEENTDSKSAPFEILPIMLHLP